MSIRLCLYRLSCFVFVCRKHIFKQSKKNSQHFSNSPTAKNKAQQPYPIATLYIIFRTVFSAIFSKSLFFVYCVSNSASWNFSKFFMLIASTFFHRLAMPWHADEKLFHLGDLVFLSFYGMILTILRSSPIFLLLTSAIEKNDSSPTWLSFKSSSLSIHNASSRA